MLTIRDNSTRGLDSANAVEFCKTLRTQCDVFGSSTFVAIYQAPQAAYDVSTPVYMYLSVKLKFLASYLTRSSSYTRADKYTLDPHKAPKATSSSLASHAPTPKQFPIS